MGDPTRSDRLRQLERASALARTRRSRARKKGLLPLHPLCPACGRKVLQERTLPLCSRCWSRTPEGRAAAVQRVQEWRHRRANQACLPSNQRQV